MDGWFWFWLAASVAVLGLGCWAAYEEGECKKHCREAGMVHEYTDWDACFCADIPVKRVSGLRASGGSDE